METIQQKEVKVTLSLDKNYRDLKIACQEFIDYVKNKYPGEDLKCPYIKKIELLVSDNK